MPEVQIGLGVESAAESHKGLGGGRIVSLRELDHSRIETPHISFDHGTLILAGQARKDNGRLHQRRRSDEDHMRFINAALQLLPTRLLLENGDDR